MVEKEENNSQFNAIIVFVILENIFFVFRIKTNVNPNYIYS